MLFRSLIGVNTAGVTAGMYLGVHVHHVQALLEAPRKPRELVRFAASARIVQVATIGAESSSIERLSYAQIAQIRRADERIDEQLEPYREQRKRLAQIPGVERVVAAEVIAEIGTDMSVFKSDEAGSWSARSPCAATACPPTRTNRTRCEIRRLKNSDQSRPNSTFTVPDLSQVRDRVDSILQTEPQKILAIEVLSFIEARRPAKYSIHGSQSSRSFL